MGDEPMRFCYADPPYPGQAKKHYGAIDPDAAEVDHAALVARLVEEFPGGWALSTSAAALRDVLAVCPSNVRTLAWVKPFASFKPGVGLAYAWEPVILSGGRRRSREQPTVRDWLAANILLKAGVSGAKPPAFWLWLFEVANLRPTDTFVDFYPGSGAGRLAWEAWCAARGIDRPQLELLAPESTAEKVARRQATARTRRSGS